MKNEIEARYEKAVEQAREAIEELRLAALAKGYEDAKRDLQAVAPVGKFTPITAQEHRDEIVEMAKRDVAELSTTWRPGCHSLNYGPSAFDPASEKVNFDVNAEKRTVVCYITYHSPFYEKTRTSFRGIAKCALTDCFNVHIGKAIALRRALGLEVPSEYLNAPQPTEVRVGDVVRGKTSLEIAKADRVDGRGWAYGKYETGRSLYAPKEGLDIIDDSRE
ncbi:hypothetical protein [Robertmurraya andreesenii]|uniref:Uncharacterized protein n=1 Tax=Anoxybacillus andreesenii TaxID=1325932 RepID=A0ABT9V1Z6_9BACL|nr:hypothetical protein [Robertmurraya andreesenii]MDQ0154977.1 hypothetical protein [Robertmurraya andreesenii]